MTKKTPIKLPNDGERMVPELHKGTQIYGEHIARYEAVCEIVRNKRVLDIASGSGYGTEIIARSAKEVVGVDVSKETVEYAQQHFAADNVQYLVGDGEKIPTSDGEFDVVVSFETIEHVKDYKKFLQEVKRTLKKDGLLILSTPNDTEYIEDNHFHLHEFKYDELLSLLKKHFHNVTPYYQATWVSNVIGGEEIMTTEWSGTLQLFQTAPIKPSQYLYFYFLCSERKISERIEGLGVLGQHWSERAIQKTGTELQAHIKERDVIIHDLRRELKKTQNQANYLQDKLEKIYHSKRWRYTQRLADVKQKFRP